MSKGQSSRRQPSLLELTQPDSWDQLNRDIQQRMQYTHPHHLPSVRDTASRVNSKERPQDNSEVSKEHVIDCRSIYLLLVIECYITGSYNVSLEFMHFVFALYTAVITLRSCERYTE